VLLKFVREVRKDPSVADLHLCLQNKVLHLPAIQAVFLLCGQHFTGI
jgi:hypothetical protein